MAIAVLVCSQALVYMSTAYSQCPYHEIREEVYPVPTGCRQILMEKCWTKKRQRKFAKCNITIINRKLFCENIVIDTVLIISNINIIDIDHLDKVLLFMH